MSLSLCLLVGPGAITPSTAVGAVATASATAAAGSASLLAAGQRRVDALAKFLDLSSPSLRGPPQISVSEHVID